MTAATTKQLTFDHTVVKPLSALIVELLQNTGGGKWQGTAYDLCVALGWKSLAPRSLAVKLKKSRDELKTHGVKVGYSKIRGRHVVKLSTTSNFTQNAMNEGNPIEATREVSAFATPHTKNYPFKWQYGTIEELNEEEKTEVNIPLTNGTRKKHFRHCQLCGEPGKIEFRKESDGNTCLLCRSCAEDYARKALWLTTSMQQKGSGES